MEEENKKCKTSKSESYLFQPVSAAFCSRMSVCLIFWQNGNFSSEISDASKLKHTSVWRCAQKGDKTNSSLSLSLPNTHFVVKTGAEWKTANKFVYRNSGLVYLVFTCISRTNARPAAIAEAGISTILILYNTRECVSSEIDRHENTLCQMWIRCTDSRATKHRKTIWIPLANPLGWVRQNSFVLLWVVHFATAAWPLWMVMTMIMLLLLLFCSFVSSKFAGEPNFNVRNDGIVYVNICISSCLIVFEYLLFKLCK